MAKGRHLMLASIFALLLNSVQQQRHFQSVVQAQGTKGGSTFASSSSLTNQQLPISTAGQFGSSLVQMFNSLTPIQQQQFIRQMSSSSGRLIRQQPQTTGSSFSEEISASGNVGATSGGGLSIPSTSSSLGGNVFQGTKSGFVKQQQQQQQILSPVQQGSIFKQTKTSNLVQPTARPSQQFSFSRQVSQSSQVPQQVLLPSSEQSSFQRSVKTASSVQPQQLAPQQQQSFFNQVQRVQQVAQPVVLPSSEQSFRRVQSFSSQPLVLPQQQESGFSQFVQQNTMQVAPQPQTSGFNRFEQSSISTSGAQQQQQQQQPVLTSNQFGASSSSSSSNLAAGGSVDQIGSLQQEKLDAANFNFASGLSTLDTSGFSQPSQQQTLLQGGPAVGFEQSTNSLFGGPFDSSDGQQKNVGISDDIYGGLTAASINNKWYIMRPVDNPSALGLGDARAAQGSIRQVPLARALALGFGPTSGLQQTGPLSSRSGSSLASATPPSTVASSIGSQTMPTSLANSTINPKKRSSSSADSNKKKKKQEEKEDVTTSSSVESEESTSVDAGDSSTDEDESTAGQK